MDSPVSPARENRHFGPFCLHFYLRFSGNYAIISKIMPAGCTGGKSRVAAFRGGKFGARGFGPARGTSLRSRLRRWQVVCGSVPRRKVWCSRLWLGKRHFPAGLAAPVACRVWQCSEKESLVLAALVRREPLFLRCYGEL